MLVSDVVESIGHDGLKSYYSFETFVINILEQHISAVGGTFYTSRRGKKGFDAYSPSGFDEYVGPTAFEVKMSIARLPIRQVALHINRMLLSDLPEQKIVNLILITAVEASEEFSRKVTKIFSREVPGVRIDIWGVEKLQSIAQLYPEKAKDIADNLFTLRLKSAVDKPPLDWKTSREEILDNLRSSYLKGQFSLFLGAGVSSSAGMPDWNTLLNSLFASYLTKEFDGAETVSAEDIRGLVDRLGKVDDPSALMAARYLRKGLDQSGSESKDFVAAITKSLYLLRNKDRPISSALIKSISRLCMPRRTGAKVKALVTYNFDDLVERQLTTNSIRHRCVYNQSEMYDPDELPVYHVHGFLPESVGSYEGLDKSTLVFSEEGYHHIYSDSYHWSNLVQLNCLREHNCLMVGLSMSDPNLRRLLDIAARGIEGHKHFAFMRRLSIDKFCYEGRDEERKQKVENLSAAITFLQRHHTLNERLMEELGVTVIWYESHEEIPDILNQIGRF